MILMVSLVIVIVAMLLTMVVPFECTDRAILAAYLFGALSCAGLVWAWRYEGREEE